MRLTCVLLKTFKVLLNASEVLAEGTAIYGPPPASTAPPPALPRQFYGLLVSDLLYW
jgi:hypothetical protein